MSNADLIARLLEAAPVENGQIVLSYDSPGEHIALDALLREAAAALTAQEEEINLRKFDVGIRDREIARLTSALQERDAMCERAREALEPFAVENEQQERYYPGQHDTQAVWREAYRIMHGDLRRASSAHAELSAIGKRETKT